MNNLEQIDLLLENCNVPAGINVSFELSKDFEVIWSTTFAASSITSNDIWETQEWFVLDTPYIELVPEEPYHLRLTSPITLEQMEAGINVFWGGTQGNPYPRGSSDGGWFDFGFQTWAVPEPSAIMLLGLGGLFWLRTKVR